MAKQLWFFLRRNYLFVLAFILLLFLSVHSFESIGQDIGRHLKIGEMIWQTKEIPRTNLFSFTEPNFSFINHHWLSEIVFFGIFSFFGFTGLILVKAILIFMAFLLLFFAIREHARSWPILISLLISIFIFIERTEVRPEIFSFIILAFFLFALLRSKYENIHRYIWFLPIAQIFWVNFHISFFIGPFLISAFLIDNLINGSGGNIKSVISIWILTIAASFVNPNGVQGALLPFKILNEYGYSIVENQTLFFLADFFNFNLSIFVFKSSVALMIISLILTVKKSRPRIFEIIISSFFIYAGFRMLRNLPLYALASFPILAITLTDISDFVEKRWSAGIKKHDNIFKIAVSVGLILLIIFVLAGSFYKYTNSSKTFGFSVPNGLERAVDFVRDNKIKGPMFNNFDIGGYLIWRLYPEEKVFIDNRPEAYPVRFFNEIYKPMQESKEKWTEFSERYNINFIFFSHTDATSWGQDFLEDIVENPGWKTVYINENAIILVKNNIGNAEIISRFIITNKNAADKVSVYLRNSNNDKIDSNTNLSRFLYNIKWLEPAIYFADEAIRIDLNNPYPYLHKGLVHASYADEKNQKLAAENIKKAIDFGLNDSRYYFILGGVYMNLGRLNEARLMLKESIRRDKGNLQAKEFLTKYFNE